MQYLYCVYPTLEVCLPGPFTKCQGGLELKHECPAGHSIGEPANSFSYENFTDTRDSKIYRTVKIGGQTWMADNLNYDDPDSKCYDNNSSNCTTYGRLYDWATAKRVCHSGWHLPTKDEFDVLINYTGGHLKSKENNGTDFFGFAALLGGYGSVTTFYEGGNIGRWWSNSTDENGMFFAYAMTIRKDYSYGASLQKPHYDSFNSVRCIKD
jgi:uncharacterized protein (TIGR02145 family)